MAEWISVKDRLPEEDTPVLIYAPNTGGIWMAGYCGEYRVMQVQVRPAYWESYGSYDECMEFKPQDVTHWMPLPEPPEGENNES